MDPELQLRHIFAANNEQDEWDSDNEAPLESQRPTFQPGFKAKVIKDNKKNVRMGNLSGFNQRSGTIKTDKQIDLDI